MLQGFIYPALHALVARWVPPAEKGKFISALMGGTLGTVVTWSLSGPLIEKFGWASAFYVPAAITLVWCVVWWFLVADTPTEHPRISDSERKYILDALGNKVTKSKVSQYLQNHYCASLVPTKCYFSAGYLNLHKKNKKIKVNLIVSILLSNRFDFVFALDKHVLFRSYFVCCKLTKKNEILIILLKNCFRGYHHSKVFLLQFRSWLWCAFTSAICGVYISL